MGRSPCCDKVGLKKGPWTPEEDHKLLAYIEEHGHGSWRALPAKAGLQRCGKSCRLRWSNYLRPDIKRGKFSLQEEQSIIQLHALLGNRWSAIATHLSKRTDNEIKNYWNTHLKKKLAKMGIDPVTHKPKNDSLLSSDDGQSKNAATLSHIAQWESARLEAEARLVRQSKLRSNSLNQLASPVAPPRCLDILKSWSGGGGGGGGGLASPTSTISFSENPPPISATGIGESSSTFIGNSASCHEGGLMKEEGTHEEDWKGLGNSIHFPEYMDGIENSMLHDMTMSMESAWTSESLRTGNNEHVNTATFTDQLLLNNSGDRSFSEECGESDNASGSGSDYYEDNKNYWNTILNLVNSSPSDSPMF